MPWGSHRCTNGYIPLVQPEIGDKTLYTHLKEEFGTWNKDTNKTEAKYYFDQLGIDMVEGELVWNKNHNGINLLQERMNSNDYKWTAGSCRNDPSKTTEAECEEEAYEWDPASCSDGMSQTEEECKMSMKNELVTRMRHLFEYTKDMCYPKKKGECEGETTSGVSTVPLGYWNGQKCIITTSDIETHSDCAAVYKEKKDNEGNIVTHEKPVFDSTVDIRCRVPNHLEDCKKIGRTFYDKDTMSCRYIETESDCLVNDSSKPVLVKSTDVKDNKCRVRVSSDCENAGECSIPLEVHDEKTQKVCNKKTTKEGEEGVWINHPVLEWGRCRSRDSRDCHDNTPLFETYDKDGVRYGICRQRCGSNQYYDIENKKCKDVTICPQNRQEDKPPAATSDRTCKIWSGNCDGGVKNELKLRDDRTKDHDCGKCGETGYDLDEDKGSCCRTFTGTVSSSFLANSNPMTIKVCTIGNDEHTATIEHNWNNSSNEDGNPWSIRIEGMTATSTTTNGSLQSTRRRKPTPTGTAKAILQPQENAPRVCTKRAKNRPPQSAGAPNHRPHATTGYGTATGTWIRSRESLRSSISTKKVNSTRVTRKSGRTRQVR